VEFAPLLAAAAAVSPTEWIAVALALAYLVLAVRQHIACWFFAASSSIVFAWLFLRSGLMMQSALQIFYVAMAAYGWWSWRGAQQDPVASRPVTRWPASWHVVAIVAVAVISVANVRLTGAETAVRYLDALIAWASVFATWLVARKILENWLYWIVLDLAAAGLYTSQGLHATALLFVLYSAIAVQGYRRWRATIVAPAASAAA